MPMEAMLLTSAEVGRLLGKSKRSVHRLAQKGNLPYAQKLPGTTGGYLFRRDDIAALIPEQVGAA